MRAVFVGALICTISAMGLLLGLTMWQQQGREGSLLPGWFDR